MNKLFFAALLIAIAGFVACNNGNNAELEAKVKSLSDSVMKGHNVGMAKYEKLKNVRARTQEIIDSIDKLPAQAKEAAAGLRGRLVSLTNELSDAKQGMDQWMAEIRFDSLNDNIHEKIRYYTVESEKAKQVSNAILNSLQKADSLLKTKF